MSPPCIAALIAALLGSLSQNSPALAPVTTTPRASTSGSVSTEVAQPSLEEQVLTNLRQEKIGTATLVDLGLPDDYLRRVAGRIVRGSFEDNFRIVVADAEDAKASDDRGGVARNAGARAASASSSSSGAAPIAATNSGETAGTESAPRRSVIADLPAIYWTIGGVLVAGLALLVVLRRGKRRGVRAR
jgi:hypothetical protein